MNYSEEGVILCINKPLHWTSFDVVGALRMPIRKALNVKKVKIGHAGTLDPLATGLLIVCVGKTTKKIEEIQNQKKEYTGIIRLGATTPSFDLETEFDNFFEYSHISEKEILEVSKSFIGTNIQTPPIFSAIKIDGKRAYEIARKNKYSDVEIPKREIEIYNFEITKIELPDVHFLISCSKGTYIRSIAHEFGQKLSSGSHLSELCRTKIGDYNLENALTVEECKEMVREHWKPIC